MRLPPRKPVSARHCVLPPRPSNDFPRSTGSGPGVDAQQSRSGVSKDLSEVTEWKELCYVDLYAAAGESDYPRRRPSGPA